jgi:hypothetical protein
MTGEGFDGTYVKKDGEEVIYLAGGCFWGMEKTCAVAAGGEECRERLCQWRQ